MKKKGFHEIAVVTDVAMEMIDEHVYNHPAITKEMQAKLDEAFDLLMWVYQDASKRAGN